MTPKSSPNVSFELLRVGRSYTRPQLANIWGYAGYQALARGVVTPRNDNKIILFVTQVKQESLEQYQDELAGDSLFWEGPTDHFAEGRMTDEEKGDEIHVFYRKRHHSPFTYEGKFKVIGFNLFADRPSKFVLIRDT